MPDLSRVWASTFPELSRPVSPRRAPAPRLLALNDDLARDLDIDPELLRTDGGLRFLTGEAHTSDSAPVAQVYAGHQWGVYKPLLGDGRAALLGERRRRSGELVDIHAKGIGPTSMSRVDGFATVGPMLREFVIGEAMHALGLPSTRALAVVGTGAPRRLDGEVLPGAVVTRVATSHIRYGSFSYAAALDDRALLRRLADHAIRRHYPEAAAESAPVHSLLRGVVAAAAKQTAGWTGVGFVQGVLSTDNVLVSGETIDYGPCAFLDAYDPRAVFSSIDRHGRYAFGRQPAIMRWNLERLGEAVAPLLADDLDEGRAIAEEIVSTFGVLFLDAETAVFRGKLGLGPSVAGETVRRLTDEALALLAGHGVDYTRFWRDLAAAARGDAATVRRAFDDAAQPALNAWLSDWAGLHPDAALMSTVNPAHIPRNHVVAEVLAAAVDGDLDPVHDLVELVRSPFAESDSLLGSRLAAPAPAAAAPSVTFCGT
ncbi:MAG: protein adenylyltransferase SelO family protein [Microbacterium enclense]